MMASASHGSDYLDAAGGHLTCSLFFIPRRDTGASYEKNSYSAPVLLDLC